MRRFRPYRADAETRDRLAEIRLSPGDLVQPYFVVEGRGIRKAIPGLPGLFHHSIDRLLEEIHPLTQAGVGMILLFGSVPASRKDPRGSAAYAPDNLVAAAIAAVKAEWPDLRVASDVCLCGYTDHGHCGLVQGNVILNDETLPWLAEMALTHARAGADFVAPSAMMDGQVAAIRRRLDAAGCGQTRILGYSAKFASAFYGPFREAAGSAPAFGDRRSYQVDIRTPSQAVEEAAADAKEGADWLMVKPALTCLDIIHRVKLALPEKTLAAYHVSGEYMMIKAAAAAGALEEEQAVLESLTAIKRSGADYIITYFAKQAAKAIKERAKILHHGDTYVFSASSVLLW